MPGTLTLKVPGLKLTAVRFYSADKPVLREAKALTKEMGEFCRELTSFLAPFDTGRMSRLVRTVYTADGLGFETGWSAADFAAEGEPFYPPFQEFGTSRMAAQPSLYPAFRETERAYRPKMKSLYARALARSLASAFEPTKGGRGRGR